MQFILFNRPVSRLIRWCNKRILIKRLSVPQNFPWIENYKLSMWKLICRIFKIFVNKEHRKILTKAMLKQQTKITENGKNPFLMVCVLCKKSIFNGLCFVQNPFLMVCVLRKIRLWSFNSQRSNTHNGILHKLQKKIAIFPFFNLVILSEKTTRKYL